ncbi:cyclic peptide export ABC transporter [Pyxidicoccus fallax]|uniref:Cyclic peptide export ABC transporter n=1 Tax=Pyxidicoccus fallax TaxID=394095 RepID=A0A848LG88_9BACT|nr:cyclic peptide export ABC transporter [Pyxidicoccus fallax]NMO14848.1 cyclic peptide export ABC transporter [Pyxidicoccus fallax]NPC82259.1 cyclic peptide export ABC transporter [Pyxidicoccus fallax]
MKLLLLLLRSSKKLALLTILFGALSGAASASLVGIINKALNPEADSSVTDIALPFVGLTLGTLFTRMGSNFLLNMLQQDILLNLRLWLSRHLLTTPLRTMEEAGAHRMLTSLMQDIITLGLGVSAMPEVLINAAVVLAGLCYMAWLSWPLFLLILGVLVVGQILYAVPAGIGTRFQMMAREQNGILFRKFMALTEGAKELRLHRSRRRAYYDEELTTNARALRQKHLKSENFFAIANGLGSLIYIAVIGVLLLVIPRFTTLSHAELLGAVLVVLYLQQPINVVTSMIPHVRRSEVAISQIEKLGAKLTPESTLVKTLSENLPAQETPRDFERIDVVGVTHTYKNEKDNEKFTVGPISTSLSKGELVFIIGGNGSGKTSFAKLLTGLYMPEAGEILVDGKTVTTETLDDYRQHFSAIFFDFHVFDRLLGLSSPDLLEKAAGYLKELQIDHKVTIGKDGKLSTTTLSQGQRKRLALLAAYLEDRPVYLFDEWAADQDPQFREVFYKKILPDLKARGKAVVVISHDDRYFHLGDRILQLEFGQVVSDARPAEKRAVSA